jgi:hypothetical protein
VHLDFSLIENLKSAQPKREADQPQAEIENHFMTLSALASTLGGIVRPICFAGPQIDSDQTMEYCY